MQCEIERPGFIVKRDPRDQAVNPATSQDICQSPVGFNVVDVSRLRFRGVDQWRIRAEQPVMHLPIAERPVFVLLLEHTLHCVE